MASKRAIRRKRCKGKQRYPDELAARAAIRAAYARGVLSHLSPYRCPFCGAMHIGHTPAHVRASMTNRYRHA